MEEKKVTKISLSTFFLILSIVVIAIMGFFIYQLTIEKTNVTLQLSELNNKVTALESNKTKLNAEITEYKNKQSTTNENTTSNATAQNTTSNSTSVKEIEKQLNVNDVIALGYNNIVFLVNGKPYYVPVFDRDHNYNNYKIQEVKSVSGKVSKVRMFNLGTDPSETTYLIYEDGHVESLSNMGNGLEAHQGVLDSTKDIVDLVEENGIVYAVSQNGEKTKIAERYPGV